MNDLSLATTEGQSFHLSRGIDYLGMLGAKLRDLRGFATLAHELIQNADDTPNATAISFDVREDALIVDNNGVFSSCGQIYELGCPWKTAPAKGHMCDFHRFRNVLSGDKREEVGTSGAFGVGFIAVYQVTDGPELLSARQHWLLREDRPENERIEVCSGCDRCQAPDLPGTRFILPWANDPSSTMRTKLRAEAVGKSDQAVLLEELKASLPTAMIFLKRIHTIEIKRDGKIVKRFDRETENDTILITSESADDARIWYLLRGEFDEEAQSLRQQHPGRIENKRTSSVTLAVPEAQLKAGLFCALLPTQHQTGLPFHINADFFPSNDRKRVVFESDYQGDWNRAAVTACAEALVSKLDQLRGRISHTQIWDIIKATHDVGKDAQGGSEENSLDEFWESLSSSLRSLPLFYSSRGEWLTAEILLLESKEEENSIPILEGLGIPIVNPDLRPYFALLRGEHAGVQLLDIPHITEALQRIGLTNRTKSSELPDFLSTDNGLETLWGELEQLLKRRRKADQQEHLKRELAACAIAPGRDGALWPCGEIYRADQKTVLLYSNIDSEIPFLSPEGEKTELLQTMCPDFSVKAAVERLSGLDVSELELAREEGRLVPETLIEWFESKREEILSRPQLRDALKNLPIFPSHSGLKPLSELVLAGDFTDPIGVTDIVDVDALGGRRDFLRDLKATLLTFQAYVTNLLPRALHNGDLPSEKLKRVIHLLAERLGEIRDNPQTRETLSNYSIVACQDGVHRLPDQVYFENSTVTEVLGADVHLAAIPAEGSGAVKELYRWLRVASRPRLEDVMRQVDELAAIPPTAASIQRIDAVFRYLAARFQDGLEDTEPLVRLRVIAWLPARGDRTKWYSPRQPLFAVFQDYLFESQAYFLALPRETQNSGTLFMEFLGIESTPEASQVVSHLLKCAAANDIVNKEVYRYLNDKAHDPALERLKGSNCLLLPNNSYVKPNAVFWAEHPFGRLRYRLGPELRRYTDLFSHLDVRESPTYEDALDVMLEIASDFGADNRPLDKEAQNVLLVCWQLLSTALEQGLIDNEYLIEKCSRCKIVPDSRGILNSPEVMLFEDRAGLAEKFPILRFNVIQRSQGAWPAMVAAGVRSLATAIESHLVECTDPVDDHHLASTICDRLDQIVRVVESAGVNYLSAFDRSILESIHCQKVRELVIRFQLRVFERDHQSLSEAVSAHFHREQQTLYFVCDSSILPWPSIAKELAVAICPELEPGRLASGIKEVLAAESKQSARSILDDLGFPPLETVEIMPSGDTELLSDLGGHFAPPEQGWEALPGETSEKGDIGSGQISTPHEAVEEILGTAAAPPTPLPEELLEPDRPPSSDSGSEPPDHGEAFKRSKRPSKQQPLSEVLSVGLVEEMSKKPKRSSRQRRDRLRTYVDHQEETSGISQESDAPEERPPVDQTGVNHVLEFERQQGRNPVEMPPRHPGYDVESKDSKGIVVRYIEVKSLSGDWGALGAGITKTQFDKALKLGKCFWLYVVERAEQQGYRIHRIQNPAQRVNQFFYDNGWVVLGEDEGESSAPETTT